MAVDVMTPKPKEKKSALDTAASVVGMGANIYSMADKAGAFERRKNNIENSQAKLYDGIKALDKK